MELRAVNNNDDFDAIGALYADSWREAYRDIIPAAYLQQLDGSHWNSILTSGQLQGLVLLEDERYIGTTSFCPARDPKREGFGEIVSLYLLPGYTGKGYGSALLNAALDQLERQGYFHIYLYVLEGNQNARRFYEMNGFVQSEQTLPVVLGGKRLREVEYTLDLNPTILL